MKTYYCVTTTFDDNGGVTAAITGITEADKKPENTAAPDVKTFTMIGLIV